MILLRIAPALLLALVPLSGQASGRCAHQAPKSLAIDLEGVKTVVLDIGSQTIRVAPSTGSAPTISARACASSQDLLSQLTLSQRREGDKLVVVARRERKMPYWDSNERYASLDIDAKLPADLMVQLRVGSGDASIDGFRRASADVGSGELHARNIGETLFADVGSGEIVADDIGALHVVSVGSGELTARRVHGDATVGGVRSGELEILGTGGDVRIESIGSGDATVRDIGGSVRVASIGSGSLRARGVRGDLAAERVGSGSVRHENVAGQVRVDD